MATGVINNPGGVAAPADVYGAGADSWAAMTGVSPLSPAVGGPGYGGQALPYDVDGGRSRIVTNDVPATMHVAAGGSLLDSWQDVLNWRGSPIPWLLLLTLVMVGFAQFRISARAGKASGNISLG
jgi:hypothetical protein